jgi:hypothetical protein
MAESATRRNANNDMDIVEGGIMGNKNRVQSSSLVRGKDNNLDLKNNLTAIVPADVGVTVAKN